MTVTTHKIFLVSGTSSTLLKPQGAQKMLSKLAIPVNVRHFKEVSA